MVTLPDAGAVWGVGGSVVVVTGTAVVAATGASSVMVAELMLGGIELFSTLWFDN